MALDALRGRNFVMETYGASGRVMRYEHNVGRVLRLPSSMVALLTVLMLRGAQTPGELRSACDRLHRFADISALEAALDDMAAWPGGAMVVKLAKRPGSREHRYAHLLCGPVQAPPADIPEALGNDGVTLGEIAALKANLAQMQSEVEGLRALVEHLYAELGVVRRDHLLVTRVAPALEFLDDLRQG